MAKPFIITIVGAESSGKTTLAERLADRFGCLWVPEYARTYLTELNRPYQLEDLSIIAKGQWELIRSALSRADHIYPDAINLQSGIDEETSWLIFQRESFGTVPRPAIIVDSGILSIRMWALLKFGIEIPFVEEALRQDQTSTYVLCRPFPEWEPDPLREAPGLLDRSWIYNQYLKELAITPSM